MNLRRYIFIAVVVILVMVGIIWLIAGRGDRPDQEASVRRPDVLVDYADTTTEVRFTQVGQINAREDHRTLQITVGRDARTIQLLDGYQGNVMASQTLGNDQAAYQSFLAALENSNYTRSRTATRGVDPLGACPLGQRYSYDIFQGADLKQSLWATSCSNVRGTFAGQGSTVRTLFQNQIPAYDTFVQGVQF